jgi:FkbM family methyltransferase
MTTEVLIERALSWLVAHPFRGRSLLVAAAALGLPELRAWRLAISQETSLIVDMRDPAALALLWGQGLPHERGLLTIFEAFLTPNGCFWDVGANLGYYAGLFSERRFAQGQVYAFEPNPALSSRLRRSLQHRTNVTVFDLALGAKPGEHTLRIPRRGSNLATLRDLGSGREVRIPVDTIDRLLEQGVRPPDLIKIDVEGWEAEVLAGFRSLQTIRPVVHFELIERFGSDFREIRGLLPGWILYRVENDGKLRRNNIGMPRTTNDLVAVHPESRHAEPAARMEQG